MAKLSRESRLREKRMEKQAKKNARKLAPPEPAEELGEVPLDEITESTAPVADPVSDA